MADEPKEFVFKHPKGNKWGQVAKSKYVFIVEGADKEELLAGWGLVASCWADEHAEAFEGKEKVVILSEDDDTGRAYASRIASVLYGKVGDLKVIELPEVEEKEELIRLIKNTPVWTPPSELSSENEGIRRGYRQGNNRRNYQ